MPRPPHFHPIAPFLALCLCVAAARPADALCTHANGGLALRWDACVADGGTASRAFACNTNLGSETLVGSYVLSAPMADVSSLRVYLDVASSSGLIPSWWQFGSLGNCRIAAFTMNPLAPASAVHCVSPWVNALGGVTIHSGYNGPASAQIEMITAVPQENVFSAPAGVETFAISLQIAHNKTVGSGACEGCSTPMCLALSEIKLTSSAEERVICGPAYGTDSHLATWQSATIENANTFPRPGEFFYWYTTTMTCSAAATPVRRVLWGAVKQLYR